MTSLAARGEAFRALHARGRAFVIPNPWDIGTARLLAQLGFEALATTSAGCAFALGKPDGAISRDEALLHSAMLASAADLPVSADLENAFADSPDVVAETFRLAGKTGLVGGSIEDKPQGSHSEVYDRSQAVERVRAAVEAVRALPFPFTLTARAENYLCGRPDLKDTISRLQAFQDAGADVLYAPGLSSREDIAAVVQSVDRPVNVLAGVRGMQLSVAELSALGVARVSIGSGLARAAFGAFLRAAREMHDAGTFRFVDDAVSYPELNELLSKQP